MQDLSDEQLIAMYCDPGESLSRKNRAADELFSRYQTRVALWCLRIAGDRDWARDLAQEVFLRALRNLEHFRGESKFSTWLYTIARNHCFNAIQSRSIRAEDSIELLDLPDQRSGSVEDDLEVRGEIDSMKALLNRTLDDTEKQVMTLHYGDEIPLAAITRLLGLQNASGAKAYVVSARRKLERAIHRLKASAGKDARHE